MKQWWWLLAGLAVSGLLVALVLRGTPQSAVVQITNEQLALDQFGRPAVTPAGMGSGVIYDSSGRILTNNHVIADARSLTVSLLGRALTQRKPGEQIQLSVARGNERLTRDVTLGARAER